MCTSRGKLPAALKVERAVVADVTRFRWGVLLAGVAGFCVPLMAAVLPEERADMLYHSYSGGGLDVNGPSILGRKSLGDKTSVWGNYYIDSITSATIDVITSASRYSEERTEKSLGVDYLVDKSTLSLSYTNSEENDFSANSAHFSISQSMFGDLTTVTMGYSRGWDEIWRSTTPTSDFLEESDRHRYRLGVTQVLTKNLLAEVNLETITDEGYLNNPYRSVNYVDATDINCITVRCSEPEVYPNTRTSNALGLRAKYFLPYRATLGGEYRLFSDTWGIKASMFQVDYTHPWKENWIFDFKYRYYTQTHADFYSDLFSRESEFTYLARDKELSSFNSQAFGVGAEYEFAKQGWSFVDKGSFSLSLDHIQFDYEDFRDASVDGALPGTEPLYSFSTNVLRANLSIWY